MTWTVTANGKSLSDIYAWVHQAPGFQDGIRQQATMVQVTSRFGPILTAPIRRQPRDLRITGTIDPAAPRTVAAREAAETALRRAFGIHDVVHVTKSDGVTAPVETVGVVEAVQIRPRAPQHPLECLVSDFEVSLSCPDGAWTETGPLPYSFGTTRVTMPLWDLPVAPLVRIFPTSGSVVDPFLRLRNGAGDILGTVTFTITLAANDYLELDHSTWRTEKWVSPTRSDAAGTWLGTGPNPPTLDPADGDVTFEVGASAGTPAGIALYARRRR